MLFRSAKRQAASAARPAAAQAETRSAAAEQAAMLQRILASQTFRQVARLKRFLEFITTETAANQSKKTAERRMAIMRWSCASDR